MEQAGKLINYSTHFRKIVAHGTTEIEVIYTDDNYEVTKIVDMYEQWLSKDDHKFMGLDFEYCDPEDEDDYRITVVQLAMKNHVLVYQWSRYVDSIFQSGLKTLNLVLLFKYENLLLSPPATSASNTNGSATQFNERHKGFCIEQQQGKRIDQHQALQGDEDDDSVDGWSYIDTGNGYEKWSATAWGFCTYDQTSPFRFPEDPWAEWPEEKKIKIGWSGAVPNTP
ncbi:hypothetical protein ACQ4PT_034984 [Festuca glaucescens]